MNIRDSYIHGADGRGVVKSLFFATAADVQANSALHVNDLVFLLADTLGTQVPLTIPTLNQNTSGYASSLLTVKSTSTSNHYLTFVDSNNTTAEAESFYTSGDIYFKPSTGVLTVKSVTVSNTFNYSGIGSDTTSNAARKIWFASSSDGTPVVSDNFKYNPSTKTLTVDKISGPTIVIGNTTLYLDGANNVLTPDTVISNTSTNNTIPSSKAVWDAILTGIQANDAMIFMGFLDGGSDLAHTIYTAGADAGYTYKVRTAGYINGEYYQVNDTFICTVDGTVAASSTNVSTVKVNWGVIEGNGDYLSIHGGTMDGNITFNKTVGIILKLGDTSNYTNIITWLKNGKGWYKSDGTTLYAQQPQIGQHNTGDTYGTITILPYATDTAPWGGTVGLHIGKTVLKWENKVIAHSGNISNSDPIATIGTSETVIATIAGVDIKAKIGSYLPSNHVYSLSITTAAAADTNQITLAASTKYKLTAGGSTYIFTTPPNTWRNIYTSGTSRVGTATNTKAMNFASSNLDITYLASGSGSGKSGSDDYFTVNLDAKSWTGATSSVAGTAGYMPGAATGDRTKFLRGDGSWVALSLTDHTHSVIINGSTKTIAAPDGDAVNLGSYLPLTGGTMVGSIIMDTGGSSEIPIYYDINRAKANGGGWAYSPMVCRDVSDQPFFNIGAYGHADVFEYAFMGAGSYNSTTNFRIYPNTIKFGNSLIAHAGNITNDNIAIGTTDTVIATIAGVQIKAKVKDVAGWSNDLVNVEKTLKVADWTTVATINTLDAGTYAIQITSGNVYASGIFSACHGSDSVIDEIPLHVSDSGTNTWRPYARISGNNLQMTTSETTGTARTYTIKILKLI